MEEKVGEVTHFYTNISVAIVELTTPLRVGDRIHIRGRATDFEQEAASMQIEHENVKEANPGDAIGLKVEQKCRDGDEVFKVVSSPPEAG